MPRPGRSSAGTSFLFCVMSMAGSSTHITGIYGRDWNIRFYNIVSPVSTRKVEKNGSLIHKGKVVQGKVTYEYCPFCSYTSTNHWTLNNHICMHLCLTLACGMKDCWFVTHSSDAMWKHAAIAHNLMTLEPIARKKVRVHTRILYPDC